MSYPFTNNPLEKYLVLLRKLKPQDETEIRALKEEYSLKSRTFDIYLSEKELALEKFEKEYPKPKAPKKCTHSRQEIRIKIHKNHTEHLAKQCLICGMSVQDLKKSDVSNWNNLLIFDKTLGQDRYNDYKKWWHNRYEILNKINPNQHIEEFDTEKFEKEYILKNPSPVCPEKCTHQKFKKTVREYKNNSTAIVLQCLICGLHIKNLSKKGIDDIDDIDTLDKFDNDLHMATHKIYSEWNSKFYNATIEERKEFNRKKNVKIQNGEITLFNKSKFATYYDSLEWKNTRQRILVRDKYKCQSCDGNAECVHHIVYDRLGCENNFDLISLCNNCHTNIHYIQDKNENLLKLTPLEIKRLKNNKTL